MVKLKGAQYPKTRKLKAVKGFTERVMSDIKWFSKFQERDDWEEAINFGEKRVICDLWKRNFKVVVGTDKQLQVIAEWLHTICTHSFAELLVG